MWSPRFLKTYRALWSTTIWSWMRIGLKIWYPTPRNTWTKTTWLKSAKTSPKSQSTPKTVVNSTTSTRSWRMMSRLPKLNSKRILQNMCFKTARRLSLFVWCSFSPDYWWKAWTVWWWLGARTSEFALETLLQLLLSVKLTTYTSQHLTTQLWEESKLQTTTNPRSYTRKLTGQTATKLTNASFCFIGS